MAHTSAPNPGPEEDPLDSAAASVTPEAERDPRFRLDPARLPVRLDLTLSRELAEHLEELAARSGRDLDDLIIEVIDRRVGRNRDERAGG